MKIKIAGLFMAFLCSAMVTGSAFAAPVVKPNIVTKTIDVRTNPSTGYFWKAEYDHSKVQLIKDYYTQDPTPSPITIPNGCVPIMMCGVPGTETFVFSGMKGSEIVLKEYPPASKIATQSLTYVLE
jgi:predicted secreted protein